jgi:hypothetical protein
MQKYELAAALARRYGYSSYLEVCTPTTGNTYAHVDKQQFSRRVRLMYHCPPDFADGEPIDLRTESHSSEALFRALRHQGEKFDFVFVDPFHTYGASYRDIKWGLHLLKPGGLMLIHDCNPPTADLATPEFIPDAWCGVTFAAYLDVVLFAREYGYVTVDTDFGCGLVGKPERLASLFGYPPAKLLSRLLGKNKLRPADAQPPPAITSQWRGLPLAEKYSLLEQYRDELLRLISTEDFCQRVGARPQVLQHGEH